MDDPIGQEITSGGGGNRTRVLQRFTRASPGAALLDPYSALTLAQALRDDEPSRCSFPHASPRPGRYVSPLDDAEYRDEGAPGSTSFTLAQAARAKLVRCVLALMVLPT